MGTTFVDQMCAFAKVTLVLIAIIWIIKIIISLCLACFYGFRVYVWSRYRQKNLVEMYGEYVVLTGATDGIGLAFARKFAERGHSLVIIGRNPVKLNNAKEELEKLLLPQRNIIAVNADLSSMDSSIYQKIENNLQEISSKIGMLVNGAGVFLDKPDVFLNIREEQLLDNVKVNCAAVLMMTRTVLPFMVSNRKGMIVNIGSGASLSPSPLFGVYSASKKFVDYFSSALAYEYRNENIEVQVIAPGMVATKMTKWATIGGKASFMTPTPDDYAVSAIATIGRSNHTSGYWFHGLQSLFFGALPDRLSFWLRTRLALKVRK